MNTKELETILKLLSNISEENVQIYTDDSRDGNISRSPARIEVEKNKSGEIELIVY